MEEVRAVLGDIDLDPASCPLANEIIQATEYFTEKEDGLSRPWFNRWFCNPPYGKNQTSAWVEHAIAQSKHSSGILLMNNTTDREWFHKLWKFPICFLKRRIRFLETITQWQDRFIKSWVRKYGIMPDLEDISDPPCQTFAGGRLVRGPQPTNGNVLVHFGNNFGQFDMTMQRLGHVVKPRK